MRLAWWSGMLLALFACAANAQRSDCPVLNAPMPMRPPGKSPDWVPKVAFPEKWDGEVKVELPPVLPASDELTDADEGHVTGVARMAQRADAAPPPNGVLSQLVDPGKTVLSEWRFDGYIRDMPRHKVTRVFSRSGSVLVIEQWNYRADGASIHPMRLPNRTVGRFPATSGGLRAPSGCVSASLGWLADGTSFSLSIAGPLSLARQRELLIDVAQSIESAVPARSR